MKKNSILAFDSIHILSPIRKIYLIIINHLSNKNYDFEDTLILYRLDRDNDLLRNAKNLSGTPIALHQNKIDALSFEFYLYLEKSNTLKNITFKSLPLYSLYTRQVKLKLAEVLKCAYRIRNLSDKNKEKLSVITDHQTSAIIQEALFFLGFKLNNVLWINNKFLSLCILSNSLIMRLASIAKMTISSSKLPTVYFRKKEQKNLPTALISLPRRRPEDFYTTYIEELESKLNIIFYSHGHFDFPPSGYERVPIRVKHGYLKGLFNFSSLFLNFESYVADILIIFKYHFNLSRSIDVVDSLFENQVDVLLNRQQTNVIDNYLAIKARQKDVFILGDLFEEIFFCDSLVCSSESQLTESVKLALSSGGAVTFKGTNSLIKYRLKSLNFKKKNYLFEIFKIERDKKVIFYASDPSKEETQRYLTELFLIREFSSLKDHVLIMKTHTQDNGKITSHSYRDAGQPENVILIGDSRQKRRMASKDFHIFGNFDFNAAIKSSHGFLTTSSTSILQALMLGVKTGIVDMFSNGYFDYLVTKNASILINDSDSLRNFLDTREILISAKVLNYCGLKKEEEEFDMGGHVIDCISGNLSK